jgi:hypothetical protein
MGVTGIEHFADRHGEFDWLVIRPYERNGLICTSGSLKHPFLHHADALPHNNFKGIGMWERRLAGVMPAEPKIWGGRLSH